LDLANALFAPNSQIHPSLSTAYRSAEHCASSIPEDLKIKCNDVDSDGEDLNIYDTDDDVAEE